MCGRFTLTYVERRRLAEELGVNIEEIDPELYRPRYNIAPTDPHWIVRTPREDREILPAKWGLVNAWAKDAGRAARQINARAESLATAPAFREAFAKRRCVVPADGFFEWIGAGAGRQPVWFHREDGGLLLFAGLYESWRAAPDTWQRTFTIVTTRPNAAVSAVHDRMPVILSDEDADYWMDPRQQDMDSLARLLAPAPDGLLATRFVSPRVNSVKNDEPSCLEPVETSQRLL